MSFKQLDRELADFRDAVATAHVTVSESVKRYVVMMDLLDAAFLLYYGDLSLDDQAAMMAAYEKLESSVRLKDV